MGKAVDRIRIVLHAFDLFLEFFALLLNWSRSCPLEDHSYFFVQFIDMVLSESVTWMFVLHIASCTRQRLEPKTDKILFISSAILNFLVIIALAFDYTERTKNKIWSLVCLVFIVIVTLSFTVESVILLLNKPHPDDDA